MFERAVDYFYGRGRLRGLGTLFMYVAVYLLLFGVAGRLITSVPAVVGRYEPQTLADVLPSLPTWWVPEHPVSFVLVVAIGVWGFFVALKGKQLDRQLWDA